VGLHHITTWSINRDFEDNISQFLLVIFFM